MKRLFAAIFLIAATLTGFGQEVKKVELIGSERVRGNPTAGTARFIKPIFSHEGATLTADSADFNQTQNTFDAYGNVVITQSNGTTVYSDLLNYNGNTRLALLTNNVRLVDGTATLTTNFLTYNMGTRIGTYTGGGQIVNAADTVISKNGYYFANSDDAYFRYDVVVNTPDVLIKTDTLRYNSTSKISYFYGPTNIYGKKDSTNLYTENGNYNTVTEQARFGKRNLYTQGSKFLRGDSLFYDGKAGLGRAINRITFVDTVQKIMLKGDLGTYRESDESTLVTRNAYVVMTTESDSAGVDSIYMTADTLYTRVIPMKEFKGVNRPDFKKDSELEAPAERGGDNGRAENPGADAVQPEAPGRRDRKSDRGVAEQVKGNTVPKDTTKTAADTTRMAVTPADSLANDTSRTRIVMAYRNVKLFKSDLQARADSIFFGYADSTLRCFRNPMIWAEGSQLSGDTVYLQLKDRKLDNMLLQRNAFIVNTELDSSKFNQVKGKFITGHFNDNKLQRMYVDGNAQSVYYTVEDSAYSGMNSMVSSRMRVNFSDNKIEAITSIRQPEGTYYPMEQIPEDGEILDGFIWKPKDRPKSKEEIIPSLAKRTVQQKPVKGSAKPAPQKPAPKKAAKKK